MKKSIVLLCLSAAMALSSNADTFGFEAGAAYWGAETSGNIRYKGDSIDLEKDLGYGDFNTNFVWASFEHPIPVIPNLKIQHTKIEEDASSNLSRTFDFDGNTYSANTLVNSTLQLNQTDFILYYELLDNWVNLDFGINGKYLDAKVSVDSSTQVASSKDLNYVVPMLYVKARFDLPFSGLSMESDISYVGYDSNNFYDLKGGISYETPFGLGATVGYRYEKLELDDLSDVYSDVEISGVYGGLFYHF